jgi:dTDP-4-dehydrorhamnose reductase
VKVADLGAVVVFGGYSLVGAALQQTADGRDLHALGKDQADVGDSADIARVLDELQPAAVVNCAVFQPVDLCESEADLAFRVNGTGAGVVARACAAREIPLTHMSTDYVFGGDQTRPHVESDCPRPLSVYAASKLAGEHLVLAASSRHRVVRTSAVFGRSLAGHGLGSFVDRMLERARAGLETRVVDDQVVSPTYSIHLAQALWGLLPRPEAGIFHAAGGGQCSRYDLARRVFEAAGCPELLSRTTSLEFGAAARRPAYSALDNERLRSLGLADLPPWERGLEEYLALIAPRESTAGA